MPPITTNYPPFVLDGTFDYPGYLLASNGMVLYAACCAAPALCVTWSPGTNGANDHFIFVSDQVLRGDGRRALGQGRQGRGRLKLNRSSRARAWAPMSVWFVNNTATNWPCSQSRDQLRRDGRHD